MQANMRTRVGLLYERTGLGISFWVSARVVEGFLLLLCLCVCERGRVSGNVTSSAYMKLSMR